MAKGFIKANDIEKASMWEQLKLCATSETINDEKFCTYVDGASDETVLAAIQNKMRPGITVVHIKRYRLEVFGALRSTPPKKDDAENDLWDAIRVLEEKIAALNAEVASLKKGDGAVDLLGVLGIKA